jgi:hypothetical protein
MKTLFSPWTMLKFNNKNMVDNMFLEDPSNNELDVLMIFDSIITSCRPWSSGM